MPSGRTPDISGAQARSTTAFGKMNRRAKLPLNIRRTVQAYVRKFVWTAFAFIALWNVLKVLRDVNKVQDVTKLYGFGPSRLL